MSSGDEESSGKAATLRIWSLRVERRSREARIFRSRAARRAIAIAICAAAMAGCKSKAKPPASGVPGLASCREALRRAPALPPHERVTTLLRGCPVCGQSFEPLVPAAAGHADLQPVNLLIAACKTGCAPRAIGRWRSLLADALPGQGLLRPWRALGEDCPAAMHTDPSTLRYASAPWFALAVIGDRLIEARATMPPSSQVDLDAERAAIAIPMPPWTQNSTGLIVPPGTARAGTPWRHLTLIEQSFMIGRLAIGRLDRAGWQLEAPGPPYPGARSSGELARDLAALGPAPSIVDRLDDVLVIAPRAAPAARAIDALRALGAEPAAIAIAVPEATALWRGAVAPHALPIGPASGPRIRIDLAAARIAAIGADGAVRASMALPPGDTLRARWQAAIGVAARHPIELGGAMPADLLVDQLVELLDDAAAAGATQLAIAPADAASTAADRGAFDAAAITAALAP